MGGVLLTLTSACKARVPDRRAPPPRLLAASACFSPPPRRPPERACSRLPAGRLSWSLLTHFRAGSGLLLVDQLVVSSLSESRSPKESCAQKHPPLRFSHLQILPGIRASFSAALHPLALSPAVGFFRLLWRFPERAEQVSASAAPFPGPGH